MAKKKQPKKNSKYWKDYFEGYYGGNITVNFNYRFRTTSVTILDGPQYTSTCQKGDKWDFQIGFFVTYVKALRNKLRCINGLSKI